MIRNTSLGKRLLAVGLVLIFSMTGCGTDNEIDLTENGIEVTADATQMTVETAPEVTEEDTAVDTVSGTEATQKSEPEPTAVPWQELTTADRMAGRTS